MDSFVDQKITGVFETFNYERNFVFHCWETKECWEKVNYLGVKIPIGKKDHI